MSDFEMLSIVLMILSTMESNLHFFLAYVGRSYKYTDRAKALGEDNFSTHRVSVGFIWQMPIF